MEATIESTIKEGQSSFNKTLDRLRGELMKIRAGKASPMMIQGIMVDYYGTPTALNQVANVSTPDSRTLAIQPWEKSLLGPIEQAIFAANLGLSPMNDGEFVRISIPPLTEREEKN